MRKKLLWFTFTLLIILSGIYLSFRLTQTPKGLTVDEASIGYNAVLISRTLHDEAGRFLPIFPLTIDGQDWKQPVTMYSTALAFKIFGPSLLTLRSVSVAVGLVSLVLVVYLGSLLLGKTGGVLAGLLYLTAPMTLIHSHLAQENIMPIPFTLVWLLGVFLFTKKKKPWFLFLSGVSLGISIFSYKGMRAIVPIWAIITVLYIFLTTVKKINKKEILASVKYCLYFIVGILPFIAVIPWLNVHYAGAVFEPVNLETKTFYNFIYPYLSSFDPSALFIKGDSTPWHSTGMHGVFLLSTLPLLISGMVSASKKGKYWVFLLTAFFLAPLLFGQVGSVYRFSRLLIFVPFFAVFSAFGGISIFKSKFGKVFISLICLMFIFNFIDFTRYYWYQYPKTEQANFLIDSETSFKQLAKISHEKNLTPYIFVDDFKSEGEVGKFYNAAYFSEGLNFWKPGDVLPPKSIVMTFLKTQPGMSSLDVLDGDKYHFLVN